MTARILLLACILLMAGPARAEEDPRLRVIAYVGRDVITAAELQSAVLSSPDGQALRRSFQGDDLERRWRNLEHRTLQEMITRRLFAAEARKLGAKIEIEETEQAIAAEIDVRGLVDRDELRARLREEGVSWEDFEERVKNAMLTQRYEGWVTRRMRLVPPGSVREFYARHRDEDVVQHRSVDGHLRQVRLRTPDKINVDQIIVQPHPEKVSDTATLSRVHDDMRRLAQSYDSTRPEDPEAWVRSAREAAPLADIRWLPGETYDLEVLGELAPAAQDAAPGTWLEPRHTLEPTADRRVRLERWDLIRVVSQVPGRPMEFREVRDLIERYLQMSIRDQEMKIAQERLWKTGAVRIVEGDLP